MPDTVIWTGASGTKYSYTVFKLPSNFNPNQHGNYIYASINAQNQWVPVYIGEGELSRRVSDDHHQAACIESKGATHVHAHLNSVESQRKAEETDLLAHYKNAYKPDGCNVKAGG